MKGLVIKRLVIKRLAAAGLALACFFGLTAAAGAQGAVRSVHGDWQIRATPRRAPRASNAP